MRILICLFLLGARACPRGTFESPLGLCQPCAECAPRLREVEPCHGGRDRACGGRPGLRVNRRSLDLLLELDAVAEGALAFNESLFHMPFVSVVAEDTGGVVALPMKCEAGLFYDPLDRQCHPCRACEPGEQMVRNCTGVFDRVCAGWIAVDLDIAGSDFLNVSRMDWGALRSFLVDYLSSNAVGYDPAGVPAMVDSFIESQQANRSLETTAVQCAPAAYLIMAGPDPDAWECRQCTACAPWEYQREACGGVSDAVCANCTLCAPWERVVSGCTGSADAVCEGGFALDADVIFEQGDSPQGPRWPNQTALVNRVPLVEWLLAHGGTGSYWEEPEDRLEVRELVCAPGEFVEGPACRTCTDCGPEAYPAAPCSRLADTECRVCRPACQPGEYEACACGGQECENGNRVCWAYAAANLTVRFELLAAPDTPDSYFDGVLAALLSLARAAGLEVLERGEVSLLGNLTANFTFTIRLVAVYALPPTARMDGLLERALYDMDQQQYPLRRRLLQLEWCPADTYAHAFDFAPLCVPCAFDPNPLAQASTPPLLRWTLAESPCPAGSARVCFGGHMSPLCVQRVGGAALGAVTVESDGYLACPGQQVGALEPFTHQPICVAVLCTPGTTGDPGYCVPCSPGAFKAGDGGGPCVQCAPGTYSGAQAGGCTACPENTTSAQGASGCGCLPGYVPLGPGGCAGCGAGAFANATSCSACPPGAYSPGPALPACLLCAPGTFAPSPSSPVCAACEPGRFQPAAGGSACWSCANGTSPLNSVRCIPCQPGSYGLLGQCSSCTRGVSPWAGATACSACPDGSGPNPNHTLCRSCPLGQTSPAGECVDCARDTLGVPGGGCADCPPGTRSDPGSVACAPCPPGTAGAHCLPCSAGAYQTGSGASSCQNCTRGLYSVQVGAVSRPCIPCARDTYWRGPSECAACPERTGAPPGAESADECLAVGGSYGAPGRAALPCPADFFCPSGAMAPAPCPPGASSNPGATQCSPPAWVLAQDGLGWEWLAVPVWCALVLCCVCALARGGRTRRALGGAMLRGVRVARPV
jgi:hypothetical protein